MKTRYSLASPFTHSCTVGGGIHTECCNPPINRKRRRRRRRHVAMAADSINSIRLRLYFDYPPPAASDCRMCWLLVDLNKCRVVADLESIIRDKFDISRKSILNLFIDNCYLPHTESIYVVRDNDAIRCVHRPTICCIMGYFIDISNVTLLLIG